MTALPPRIWIVGPCGSGKSHVADVLARRLGVAAVHVDDLHWKPGWVESGDDELRSRVEAALAAPRWVVDGNYGSVLRGLRERADLVLWLDLPFATTFPRVVVRTIRRRVRGEVVCNGNRESLRTTLLSRDSILWWAMTTHRRTRRLLSKELGARPHVRLRSTRAVAEFLSAHGAA